MKRSFCLFVLAVVILAASAQTTYAYTLKLPVAVIRDIMDRKEKGEAVTEAEDIIVQTPNITVDRDCDQGVIILGDSRTSYMGLHTALNDTYKNYVAISCGGEGFGFLAGIAIPEAEKIERIYPDIHWKYVIGSGLNDMERIKDYMKLYKKLLDSGKDVYFMSINPIEPKKDIGYGYENSTVRDFNRRMRKAVPSDRFIDSYSKVPFVTVDGVHNDEATSAKLFEYIQKTVNVPAQRF